MADARMTLEEVREAEATGLALAYLRKLSGNPYARARWSQSRGVWEVHDMPGHKSLLGEGPTEREAIRDAQQKFNRREAR